MTTQEMQKNWTKMQEIQNYNYNRGKLIRT